MMEKSEEPKKTEFSKRDERVGDCVNLSIENHKKFFNRKVGHVSHKSSLRNTPPADT